MTYDQQILAILTEVGEQGISIAALSKHIYNLNATFFFQPNVQEIRQYVQQYLLRNSKSAQSLVQNTGKRGHYRLNIQNSADARQLMLHFKENTVAAEDEKLVSQQDLSLNLFPDF